MKQITEKNVKSVELLPYDQGEDQLKGHLIRECVWRGSRHYQRLAATPTRLHLTTFINK